MTCVCCQEYTLADELIVQLKAVMWSGDVEGQTREAVRRAKDVRLELDLERVNTARQRALAEAEEARNAALEERILAEQKVLANMKQFLLRTLERAEGEVKRAEIAEKALAETKVPSLLRAPLPCPLPVLSHPFPLPPLRPPSHLSMTK